MFSFRNLLILLLFVAGIVATIGLTFPAFWQAVIAIPVSYPIISAMMAVFAMVILLFVGGRWSWAKYSTKLDKKRERRMDDGERIGWYFNSFKSNFVLRAAVSFSAGQMAGLSLYLLDWVLGSNVLPFWAAITLGTLLAVIFGLNDKEKIIVPKNYVAIVTFFGMRLNLYLDEGDHLWYGGRIGFGVSTDPLPNSIDRDGRSEYPGEASGFVYMGQRPIQIWAGTEGELKEKMTLENVAHDGSTIRNAITVTLKTLWPLRWANSDDPILDVAERSRSALRTLVSFFVGSDNILLKSVFSGLLEGKTFVGAFTSDPVKIHPEGSVVRNVSKDPIFKVVPEGEKAGGKNSEATSAEIEAAKEVVREAIMEHADPEMRETAMRDGIPFVQEKKVVDHLEEVVKRNGAYFVHASVSTVRFSDEVERQANVAAGENFQRVAQVQSAKTIKKVREILVEGLDHTQPGAEQALMAALAKDGHADIVYVPGADRLTRAAVAGGKQIGGKK